MTRLTLQTALLSAAAVLFAVDGTAATGSSAPPYDPKPFKIDLGHRVPRMLRLANDTRLPAAEEYPGVGDTLGISLAKLQSLRREWVTSFDWMKEEAELNKLKHYTVTIDGQTIHYIHEPSPNPHAIPLILHHGWPGSFLEFLPLIPGLTNPPPTNPPTPSFHVVIPSLPGYAFSSSPPPPQNWTVADTSRALDTLMTRVLGYGTYAAHGTDWGCAVAYGMYERFNASVRALHLNFLPFFPPVGADQLAAQGIVLTAPEEEFMEGRTIEWNTRGNGYFIEQSTKPNTIGLALQDNPVGQLAWIAEKFIDWSDPRQGTAPSLLTSTEILRSVSLYYLTGTFTSAAYVYAQNPNGFRANYTRAPNSAPLLYTSFRYNIAFWPRALVERVGNLVEYFYHDFGGHFPGLDNPPALLSDLQAIGKYFDK